jgi:hypothetical protein
LFRPRRAAVGMRRILRGRGALTLVGARRQRRA